MKKQNFLPIFVFYFLIFWELFIMGYLNYFFGWMILVIMLMMLIFLFYIDTRFNKKGEGIPI